VDFPSSPATYILCSANSLLRFSRTIRLPQRSPQGPIPRLPETVLRIKSHRRPAIRSPARR
jgi:hypothetical protein